VEYINIAIFCQIGRLTAVSFFIVKNYRREIYAATTGVPGFIPVNNFPSDIYGCGGGLHVPSINAPQLLEIYCHYFVCAADARSVSDS